MNTPHPASVLTMWPHAGPYKHGPARAFTLIEMIGVLTLVAILAAVFTPSLAQQLSRANASKEESMLTTLTDGLLASIAAQQSIPGPNTWVSRVASMTGLASNEVARTRPSDASTARIYLIHPNFSPCLGASPGVSDPIWSQSSTGAVTVAEARIMILSVHKPGLALPVSSGAASSAAAFDAIWNWTYDPTTDAPPSGWPSNWNGNGEYLHVGRINLMSNFQRATFSNSGYPDALPFISAGSSSIAVLDAAHAFEGFYLNGTLLRLYEHNPEDTTEGDLNLSHTVQGPVNFVYDGEHWSSE
ncbi:MAG: type II secretion system protein [Verrucomicrobiales bacterium]|nr:type II secretion system protein [Verrucomicrobiales bacterium]